LVSTRLALSAAVSAVAALVGGLVMWVATSLRGVSFGLTLSLEAGVNSIPTAWVVLGLGALVASIRPSFATAVVYAVVGGSFVLYLAASMVSGLDRLRYLSLFHYLRLVPAAAFEPARLLITAAVGIGLGSAAIAILARRDLGTG
jgi:putative exporter of polyketide antibiotics